MEGLINLVGMSLSKLREMGKDREAYHAAVHRVTKSRTRLNTLTYLFSGFVAPPTGLLGGPMKDDVWMLGFVLLWRGTFVPGLLGNEGRNAGWVVLRVCVCLCVSVCAFPGDPSGKLLGDEQPRRRDATLRHAHMHARTRRHTDTRCRHACS